jgi:aspartyl-tRNA(Asn)/glutamyl-tRNA(Gln) amidotransferase subunit A
LPAAYTGVCAFKPSYGRISRWGVIQYANSLDTVGILGRKVEDLRRVFGLLDRHDAQDPTSLPVALRRRISQAENPGSAKSLRIGIPAEYNVAELSPIVREVYTRTLQALRAAGHTLVPVSLPTTRLALSAYYVLAPAEASSNLAKYDGTRYGHRTDTSDAAPNSDPPLPLYAQTRGEAFGPEVKRRILLGAYTLSSEAMDNYFIQAQKVRRLVQQDFDRVFRTSNPLLASTTPEDGEEEKVDCLLTPTAPTLPPTVDDLKKQSPLESYMNDVFTVPASLAGLPAISVPVALTADQRKGMDDMDVRSVGMQLIGQFGDDGATLNAAEIVEELSL